MAGLFSNGNSSTHDPLYKSSHSFDDFCRISLSLWEHHAMGPDFYGVLWQRYFLLFFFVGDLKKKKTYILSLVVKPTPLKRMSSSIRLMTFPTEWKHEIHVPVTTNQYQPVMWFQSDIWCWSFPNWYGIRTNHQPKRMLNTRMVISSKDGQVWIRLHKTEWQHGCNSYIYLQIMGKLW